MCQAADEDFDVRRFSVFRHQCLLETAVECALRADSRSLYILLKRHAYLLSWYLDHLDTHVIFPLFSSHSLIFFLTPLLLPLILAFFRTLAVEVMVLNPPSRSVLLGDLIATGPRAKILLMKTLIEWQVSIL